MAQKRATSQPVEKVKRISTPRFVFLLRLASTATVATTSPNALLTRFKYGKGGWRGLDSLLGRVVGKSNALLDVALEILDGLFQELLLLRGDALQNVDGLLGTIGLCT
jgi:hypothetical protein